jgi:Uma2 family endonuclease
MNARLQLPRRSDPLYPDNDGAPIAENTLQFRWIVTIKENLELLFLDRDDVFVAGDLLWYAVEGDPSVCLAPDALVVFGRPKGDRGSYQQWNEGGVAPQVVFEVLSPSNRPREMVQKHRFYERYGVEEYYVWDPDRVILDGWRRQETLLEAIPTMHDWVSPRLGVRFAITSETLQLFRPDGQPFRTFAELEQLRLEAERLRLEAERLRLEAERLRLEAERRADKADARADEADARADRLAAQLRALGIEPEK